FASIGRAAPISDHTTLPDASPDIAEGDAANELVVTVAEDKKWIAGTSRDFILKSSYPMAKGALREIVLGPAGFPWREKGSALLPQTGPAYKIAHHWLAQVDAWPAQYGRIASTERQADHDDLGEQDGCEIGKT